MRRLQPGTLHHICQALYKTINNEKGCPVLYYTTQNPIDITNAIFLLGAFLCLKLGATPNQAWRPFSRLPSELVLPYRDATWVKSTYDLHVRECWAGLLKAVKTGIYVPATFDKNEVRPGPCLVTSRALLLTCCAPLVRRAYQTIKVTSCRY